MTALWLPDTARRKVLRCNLCKGSFLCADTEPSPVEMREFGRHVKACVRDHDERIQSHLAEVADNPFLTAQDSEKVEWFRRRRG